MTYLSLGIVLAFVLMGEPTAAQTTFTYDLVAGTCVQTSGASAMIPGRRSTSETCNALSTNAVCALNPTAAQIAQNTAALRSFRSEAQRHTRPAEPGYPGGDMDAGNPYPDANIDNQIVLSIGPCNKLQYDWNEWTMLIRHVKVVGAGSDQTVLQNVSSQDFIHDLAGRANYDFFGDGFYGVLNDTYPTDSFGYLIADTAVGDTQVTLQSVAGAANFYVGRWVLVMSYVQDSMGSYPPNMRYYDWAKVTAIDTVNGIINIDAPLQFAHLSSRPFAGPTQIYDPSQAGNSTGVGIVGPARIVNIDTPVKPIAETYEFDGVHFLLNPISPNVNQFDDGWLFTGIIDTVATDLIFDGALDTTQMRSFTLTNSFAFYEEADKIIGLARYVNDTFTNSLLHSGQLVWHATGGTYGGNGDGELSCAALNCIIDGGAVLTAALSPSGFRPDIQLDRLGLTDSLSVDSVTFNGNGALGNAAINAWQGFPYTIGATAITLQPGPNGANTRLAISKCVRDPDGCTDMGYGGTMAQEVTSNWGDGSTLVLNHTLVLGATITSITGDGTNIYVDVTGTTLVNGQPVYFSRVNSVSVTNSAFSDIGNRCLPSFGPDGCIRYPIDKNIPSVIWSGNSGG